MKRLLLLIPLVFLCCFTVGCQQGERALVEPKADVEADIQAIRNIFNEYNATLPTADLDKYMSLYADDTVLIAPQDPSVDGKESNRAFAQELFNRFASPEDFLNKLV